MEKQFSRNAPSPRYVELLGLYKEMHDDGQEQEGIPADQMFAGHSLVPLVRVIKQVVDRFTPRTLLARYIPTDARLIFIAQGKLINDPNPPTIIRETGVKYVRRLGLRLAVERIEQGAAKDQQRNRG